MYHNWEGGLIGQTMGMCVSYFSVKSESAKAMLAAQYLEEFGEVLPGMVTRFPNCGVLKQAVSMLMIACTWDGFIAGLFPLGQAQRKICPSTARTRPSLLCLLMTSLFCV
jgi:hypothetical protein